MSEEKSLVDIAIEASLKTRSDLGRGFYWSAIVSAVEKEVIARLNKSEAEPAAGQELTFVQVAQWVENHGSTQGLQWRDDSGNWWKDEDVTTIYAFKVYRVAPKKINDPDDPSTWEKGVAIFCRDYDYEGDAWVLDTFKGYSGHVQYKYRTEHSTYKHAKLATPEQIEAWKLINDENCG